MKLSLCITTYNRPEMTLKSFEKVLNDPRIDEIIISDDCSTQPNTDELIKEIQNINFLCKIHIIRNSSNLGMSLNKKKAIELAKNDWCILLDSDNVIDSSYLDSIEKLNTYPNLPSKTILCPAGALPNFDYTKYEYKMIHPDLIRMNKNDHILDCMLNTCNYVVHRDTYLKNYVHNPHVGAADTIWHTFNHLNNGGYLYVVPGMFYQHMVHEDSGWMKDRKGNSKKFQEIKKMIMAL